jgi:hypothetical protein
MYKTMTEYTHIYINTQTMVMTGLPNDGLQLNNIQDI